MNNPNLSRMEYGSDLIEASFVKRASLAPVMSHPTHEAHEQKPFTQCMYS
jgi:hypothetical protein